MPVFRLDKRLVFPPVELADDGLLAVGGDLSVERLLVAYSQGVFPWYGPNLPILWHAPDPRMVLFPDELVVNRSLRKTIRRQPYALRIDTAFAEVLDACAAAPRPGQDGTWLIPDMVVAYRTLHARGFAHSFEAWAGDELVGGLYGVSLGNCFYGESMFARAPDASKVAFAAAVAQLGAWGFELIDCQVHTDHLARFGAREIARADFMTRLTHALDAPTRRGRWAFDLDLEAWAATGGVGAGGSAEA
ncbi:MAG: leucyl/phenylalanyl-tRNA--protein transferase [Kofleriaceae bacterium]